MLRTEDLDFELPDELIATRPPERRDAARLLVISRGDPAFLEHRSVRDLPDLAREGDLLVANESGVAPARFEGFRVDTGGKAEGLVLAQHDAEELEWTALVKSRRAEPGVRYMIGRVEAVPVELGLLERDASEPGAWRARVYVDGEPVAPGAHETVLNAVGLTPLPPYILSKRRRSDEKVEDADDRARYQTVFADQKDRGSVAAPTAGLHLTNDLLGEIRARGVGFSKVKLHVGPGTFRPIECDALEDHDMHAEWRVVPDETADAIRQTRRRGGRVIAVGTTTARALESVDIGAPLDERTGPTSLFITPGHEWRNADALLTNFHLPRSTLLAMVSSLLPGGVEQLLDVYATAIDERYRFFSYGDAMIVLP